MLCRGNIESNTGWDMNVVQIHVDICRSSATGDSVVLENIKKARRTMYSLMSAGLHGENGLDPETSLHIYMYQIYVLLVLL